MLALGTAIREMPYGLPDVLWWWWAIAAAGGAISAVFVARFSDRNRAAGFVAAVIAVLAAMCGVLAISVWIGS